MRLSLTRREALLGGALLLGSGCLCRAAPPTEAKSTCCSTPDLEPESVTFTDTRATVDLSKAGSLAEVGDAAFLVGPERRLDLILVHRAPGQFVALSRCCTHGGQVLSYARRRGVLVCNNYNHSIFDLAGQVVKGPAAKPLESFKASVDHGMLHIELPPQRAS